MSKPRDNRHKDLFRPALDEIIDLGHPLARLAEEIDWDFLDRRFASVCAAGPGQPPLPSRLVAGLLILKQMHDLSDEVLCARWIENNQRSFGIIPKVVMARPDGRRDRVSRPSATPCKRRKALQDQPNMA